MLEGAAMRVLDRSLVVSKTKTTGNPQKTANFGRKITREIDCIHGYGGLSQSTTTHRRPPPSSDSRLKTIDIYNHKQTV